MKILIQAIVLALSLMVLVDASAQRIGGADAPIRRNQSGGINYAPPPGVFVVVSVDSTRSTVRLRAADGTTADVQVGGDIYDLSKVRPGDRLQVDFLQADDPNSTLQAATVWPVR
jgi:hypothetical protein